MYFYVDDSGQQKGPVVASDLPQHGVTPQTPVWRQGMSDWQPAGSVAELSGVFTAPPPVGNIPQQNNYQQWAPQPAKSKVKGWMIAAGIAVFALLITIVILLVAGGGSSSAPIDFCSLSSHEQSELLDDLYERIEDYFVPILEDGLKAVQFAFRLATVDGFLDKEGERIMGEWAVANNIDASKLECVDEDLLGIGYIMRLVQRYL